MKKLKRQLAGILIFTVFLSIFASGTLSVQAAGTAAKLSYENETISVGPVQTDETVEYALYKGKKEPAVGDDGKLNVTIKDTEWELVETAETDEIDLSWVPKTKEATIIIRYTKGAAVTYEIVKFPVQEDGLKVGFALEPSSAVVRVNSHKNVPIPEKFLVGGKDTGYLYFYVIDQEKNVIPQELTNLQWKKSETGNYRNLDKAAFAKNLHSFKARGAKLYFKIKASVPKAATENWTSEEVVYSYKKQGNAPKVTVDVAKRTLTFKTGQEYRVNLGDGKGYGEWVSVDEQHGKKVNGKYNISPVKVGELVVDPAAKTTLTEDQIYSDKVKVQVRMAMNSNKGLLPSKIQTIPIVTMGKDTIKIGTTETDEVQVSYAFPYDVEKGIIITNTTEAEYEWACAPSANEVVRWNRLSAAKTTNGKTKFGTARIAANTEKKTNYDPAKDQIVIRLAGDRKTGKLAGKVTPFSLSGLKATEQTCTGLDMEDVGEAAEFKRDMSADNKIAGATITLKESKDLDVELPFIFDETITRNQTAKITKEFDGTAVAMSALKVEKQESDKKYYGTSTLKVKAGAAGNYVFNVTLESVKLKITVIVPQPTPLTPDTAP